jgi:hypothetical protein
MTVALGYWYALVYEHLNLPVVNVAPCALSLVILTGASQVKGFSCMPQHLRRSMTFILFLVLFQ